MHYSRRVKRVFIGFLAMGLILGFIVVGSFRFADSKKTQEQYEQERSAMRSPEPNRYLVKSGSHPRIRRYAAQLEPWMRANVPAEVAGRVTEVLVEAGETVEPGQPLIRLDDHLARLDVDRAQANREEAQRLVAEASRLNSQKAISETQYQSQLTNLRVADAELSQAEEMLKRHTIKAPFAGRINRRAVDVGDATKVNEPVLEMVDLEKLRVEFYVSENDLKAFPIHKPLQLLITSKPGDLFEPKVDYVSKSADIDTRLFRVEAVLPNPGETIPGGVQGIVSTEIDRFEGLPFVPAMAVRFLGRKSLVWREEPDGSVKQVEVIVGPELDGVYPVLSGISQGDTVVIR